MRRWIVVVVAVAVASLALAGNAPASANHSWGKYHWGRTPRFQVDLGNNVAGSAWADHLGTASAAWSVEANATLRTAVVTGESRNADCPPTSGRVEVCAAEYGTNGWLGIARIWAFGDGHITQGVVQLNDTYYTAGGRYDTAAWRQFVMCQEIGHTFGLGHVNEVFTNTNTGSCMDYTNDPDGADDGVVGANGALANTAPNQHDFDQLASIYSHHSTTGTPPKTRGGGKKAGAPADWGRPISAGGPHGHADQFERDLGNGMKVITHVYWADHDHEHDH